VPSSCASISSRWARTSGSCTIASIVLGIPFPGGHRLRHFLGSDLASIRIYQGPDPQASRPDKSSHQARPMPSRGFTRFRRRPHIVRIR
jgi:hypothetical protein